jgi:hypothetical protein
MTNQLSFKLATIPLEVHRLELEIPVGYLMPVNARHPGRLKVDFSVLNSRVNGALSARHRHGRRSMSGRLIGRRAWTE